MLGIARVALLATAVAVAINDDATDKEWLEGDWKIVSLEREGAPTFDQIGFLFRVSKGKAHFIDPDNPCEVCETVVALFPNLRPKEIDLKYTGEVPDNFEPGDDLTIHGIYRRDGERLILCLGRSGGDPRPADFKTAKGEESELMVLERLK